MPVFFFIASSAPTPIVRQPPELRTEWICDETTETGPIRPVDPTPTAYTTLTSISAMVNDVCCWRRKQGYEATSRQRTFCFH